jgi:DNA-binding NarL/FixJ family response regulator
MMNPADIIPGSSHALEPNMRHAQKRTLRVLVVDDHALVCIAVKSMLTKHEDIQQIVTVRNYAEAEVQAAKMRPDVIWLDLCVAESDGIEEIHRLKKLSPDTRILALADTENEQEALAAILAGAQGYLSKQDINPEEIITMIDTLCQDEFVLRPRLISYMLYRLRAVAVPTWKTIYQRWLHDEENDALAQLTARECEILKFISLGYRDRDIARSLYISEKTVQKHVQSVLGKLGARNRTEAAHMLHLISDELLHLFH